MSKAPLLVMSSGGLHSLVAAGVAARDSRVVMVHLKDGRATAAQAAAAFEKQAAFFKPLKAYTVDAGYFRQMPLPPEVAGVVHSTSSDAQAPLVPMRELQLLAIAAGFARQVKASAVVWGAQVDAKQADALARSIELVQVMNQAVELLSVESPVTIRTPLMGLDDGQVIELGYQMSLPFAASWTCQMPLEAPCMSCPACARRIRAFRAAQLVDPLTTKKPAARE